MKRKFLISFGLTALIACTGCGDLINSLRQESREADEQADRDRDDRSLADGTYKPKNLQGLTANNVSEYQPSASRNYGRRVASRLDQDAGAADDAVDNTVHRVTRADFVDKEAHENSLWDGQGQNNYLFANNRRRDMGDMVTADVEKELRREIQYQLWLTLPPEQRRTKRAAPTAAAGTAGDSVTNTAAAAAKDGAAKAAEKPLETRAKDAAEEAAKTNLASNGKDDDTIKMEVVENLGNGLMRVLGQKRVVYKGVSRIVEVAALVNNKDIDDANHTKSSNFLDMKAQVIQ